jgi:DNA-binding transcriptional ArsR family regulator
MRAAKHSALVTLSKILQKSRALWIYPTQRALLELLTARHAVDIKRRQLNYHLADLERDGLIRRIRRWGRRKDGTVYLRSSAYCLTIAGCKYLAAQGVAWAITHAKRIKQKYAPHQKRQDTTTHNDKGDPHEGEQYRPFTHEEFRRRVLDAI